MNRFLLLAVALAVVLPSPGLAQTQAPKLNFVLIFVDDLGWMDLSCQGSDYYKTPNVDRLAAEGTRFTNAYAACAVCSPTRAAVQTGRYPGRVGVTDWIRSLFQRGSIGTPDKNPTEYVGGKNNRLLCPPNPYWMEHEEVTIAEALHGHGYKSAYIGKWHLGHLPPCLPTYQGFDSYWGIPYSNDMWIDPANKLAADINLRNGVTLDQLKAGHKQRNVVPILRNEEVVEYPADQNTITKRYTEEAIRFITEKRDQPFFLYLPHTMVHLPLAVSEAFNNPEKELITNAIEEVDWSVGEVLKAIKSAGIANNTLVIFTSDNGAAVGSSLPLRGRKASVYDGGIREPTLMWWPGKIPAGSVCSEVAASIDIMPTLVSLSGGEPPARKIDGKNIWPLMNGTPEAKSPHDTYVLLHGPGTVRSGKWKFYPWKEGQGKQARDTAKWEPSNLPVQLYDTVADIGERTNLADQHPEIVAKLQLAYDQHFAEVNANKRPTAELIRPANSVSSERPGAAGNKQPAKQSNNKNRARTKVAPPSKL